MRKIFFLMLVLLISSTTILSAERLKNKFPCSFCEKRFSQNCHRERHELTHFDTKGFQCVLCGHEAHQRANMGAHVKIHTITKKNRCDWGCGYSFTRGRRYSRLAIHRDLFGEEDHANKVETAVQANQKCLWKSKVPDQLPRPKKHSRKRKLERDQLGHFVSKRPRIFIALCHVLDPNNIIILNREGSDSSAEATDSSKINGTFKETYLSGKLVGQFKTRELISWDCDPFKDHR